MLWDSSDGIEEYTTSVIGFTNKYIDDVILTYPNQKPWITGNIRTELKARAATFKGWDSNLEAYKKSPYALRWTIKTANNTETCMRGPAVPEDCDHAHHSRRE